METPKIPHRKGKLHKTEKRPKKPKRLYKRKILTQIGKGKLTFQRPLKVKLISVNSNRFSHG